MEHNQDEKSLSIVGRYRICLVCSPSICELNSASNNRVLGRIMRQLNKSLADLLVVLENPALCYRRRPAQTVDRARPFSGVRKV